jgi:hypothetical protein
MIVHLNSANMLVLIKEQQCVNCEAESELIFICATKHTDLPFSLLFIVLCMYYIKEVNACCNLFFDFSYDLYTRLASMG